MKKLPLAWVALLACLTLAGGSSPRRGPSVAAGGPDQLRTSPPTVAVNYGKMPLYFIANKGQLDERVAYYVQGKDKSLFFTTEGVTIVLNGSTKGKDRPEARVLSSPISGARERPKSEATSDPGWVVKLDFVGANPEARPVGVEETPAVISYFKGKTEEWKAGCPTYSKIVYQDLWPGIDLHYYGTVDRMKYEFIVHPGADPSRIQLAYRGADTVDVTSGGRLAITTPRGGFEDDVPVAWQDGDGEKTDVPAAYVLWKEENSAGVSGSHGYGFKVGEYDRSRPLILDPAVLVYCGFIGGFGWDEAEGIAVDGSGNAYITGFTATTAATFPVSSGLDATYNGGGWDAFVAKVNASGTALVYCGYIGGSADDEAYGVAVDGTGNAYVVGRTESTEATFPVLLGPDLTYNDGTFSFWDGFIAKVNPTGTTLVYCGFIGGYGRDAGYGIVVDSSGYAFVAGGTSSSEASFPVISGPDLTFNGSGLDGFVAKVNLSGTALVYCGYIGGDQLDSVSRIAIDGLGNAYVAGGTGSTEATFPVVIGPDLTFNGGPASGGQTSNAEDAFVAKVNPAGTALVYCGYIGGSNSDFGSDIAVDGSGNAYVTGFTASTEATFPVVSGPDLTSNGLASGADAFIAKVNASGTALGYCGYIGGAGIDQGNGIAVDPNGNAYVAGYTYSTEATFPAVSGPDLTYNGGADGDAFVAKVNSTGGAFIYCGYIGGARSEECSDIAVDTQGNAYVTGRTNSTEASFPVIAGPDLTYNGDSYDVFVAKISEVASSMITVTSPNGGESWAADSIHNVTWTSAGPIDNVKIEFSTDGGTSWSTIVFSMPNHGTFGWTVPGVASSDALVRVSDAADAGTFDASDAVFTIVIAAPTIHLSKTTLNFGSQAGTTTGPQNILISNASGGTLAWTATPSAPWIAASPGSGSGTRTVIIGVDATGLAAGSYSGTVAFTDPNATNSPQSVTINLIVYGGTGTRPPFGDFASPLDGTTNVAGAIPVTGWVLDDIGVDKVEIWRDPVFSADEADSFYFIGNGLFVEGARPDIETGYPDYPMNSRAGWGYMLLTNFLPNQGNGTYRLHAIATDKDGHTVTLGTKTITCDNAHAEKPFGTIDTPAQGGTSSGTFFNFGWVLTPLNGTVPKDGHTITIYVDGVLLGNLSTPPNVYNAYRSDVSNNFPGLNNTGGPGVGEGGPVGAFSLNTTGYANGVHTIHWIAYDDLGRGEGIGSRFFSILNAGTAPEPATAAEAHAEPAPDLSTLGLKFTPVRIKTGFDPAAEFQPRFPDKDGILRIEIPEVNRVEIELSDEPEAAARKPSRATPYSGYMAIGKDLRPLPVGSTLDRRTGRFSWMPGPGFLGSYDLVFIERSAPREQIAHRVRVTIVPKR